MSDRPRDWSPMRGSDPTPGDPDDVAAEARHYSSLATEIRSQITRLKRIGQDGVLVGDYADELRDAADGIVGDLEKVEDRFAEVASALSGWSGPLRSAQGRADAALASYRAAEQQLRALGPPPTMPAEPTSADTQAAAEHARRVRELERQKTAADRECSDAECDRDVEARKVASRLDDAVGHFKDRRFEGVRSWASRAFAAFDALVTKYADALKKIAEVLSYVALAFAVLALIFTPVGWLALAAVVFTVGAAATRLALASTGNGSWADFGMEVFALLTFGVGRLAVKGLKGAHAATAATLRTTAHGQRAATSARRAQLGRQLGRRSLSPTQRTAARQELDKLKTAAEQAKKLERTRAPERLNPSRTEVLRAGGDRQNAQLAEDIARMRRSMPSLPPAGNGPLNLARGAFATGATVDLGDKALGSSDVFPRKPFLPAYDELKGSSAR